MKRNILVFVLFSFLSVTAVFASADVSQLTKANAAYGAEKFEDAVNMYEDILRAGSESPAVYYNLGNSYYKLGKIAPAILNFERVLLLNSNDQDAQYNLEMAKAQTVDKIEKVDRFFLLRIVESMELWFTSNGWAYISIISFILMLVCTGLFVFSSVASLKKVAFFSGIVLFLFCFVSMYFSAESKSKFTSHEYAIIFAPSVTVKSSPDNSGKDIFLLHEGTKVKITSDFGNKWLEIQLEDGTTGWVLKTAAERI
ncbi:MAG TPA: tetratricopeptide repeat protein [Paludibacteraceae bacterium]|mgnify:CR=1 FL=1|nr:tetratricopeptide repeat protein [Paludibacteraceae bacterium]HPH62856.1 tetratricopeptide repeat protein [Paludibacteraceae bacterium]